MAAKSFLRAAAGRLVQAFGVVVSAGSANDGDITALDATGRLDASVMPLRQRITVSSSRDLVASDIGNILVYTAAVTLNVTAGFGSPSNVIFFERNGASASLTLTPIATSGTPRVEDPLPAAVLLDGLMGAMTCKSAGIWVRQV